jgi:hypothetical protein
MYLFIITEEDMSQAKTMYSTLRGPDYDFDCPSLDCDGWLVFYDIKSMVEQAEDKPVYVKCSNEKKAREDSCKTKTMLSKYSTPCGCCEIKMTQVIIVVVIHFFDNNTS